MDFVKEAENAVEGSQNQGGQQNNQQNNQQSNNNQSGGQSSGSLLGGVEQAGEDGMINTEVNNLMTKEGLPQGADGAVDAFVDKEANSFLGGNKNF